jgi:hypothetical protein
MTSKPTSTFLSILLGLPLAAVTSLAPASIAGAQSLPTKPSAKDVTVPAQKTKNLLPALGQTFDQSRWDQRDLLNSTSYATLLALSIDASTNLGQPILLDPDSTMKGLTSVEMLIEGLNQKNYMEHWRSPYLFTQQTGQAERQWCAFSQISYQQITNDGNTGNAIKTAIDNNQAVIFTYNFIKDDCSSKDEFFRLKFNLAENEHYPDDSRYDSLYDTEHTMCIVGYDDSDESFIIVDSRSSDSPFTLPGLAYLENIPGELIKIPQNLDYANFFYKSNNTVGVYRHEFFTVAADWVVGDTQPPTINNLNMSHNPNYPPHTGECYNISAHITDNVKVANNISATINIPDVGDVSLYHVFKDDDMTCTIPILDSDSMSAPITATITLRAYDTSGNEAAHELQCYFHAGLPLSFFTMPASRPALQSNSVAASSTGGIFTIPMWLDAFNPIDWSQTMDNCVAYGSLVAVSFEASKAHNKYIRLDPDSTLSGGTKVPKYIANLNNRGYLQEFKRTRLEDPKYPFSHIEIQQIGNTNNARNEIKAAIDNNQPVVFSFNYWKNGGEDVLIEFWNNKDQDELFDEIKYPGNTSSKNGHTMCIVGYKDDDKDKDDNPILPYFIVQNSWSVWSDDPYTSYPRPKGRQDGTLRIPQDIDYRKWLYWRSWWPATIAGGEYMFEFYKLVPHWIIDKQPPVIDYICSRMPVTIYPGQRHEEYSVVVTDNVKVERVEAAFFYSTGVINATFTKGSNNTWKLQIYSGTSMSPLTLIPVTLVVTAYDSSGNSSEQRFLVHFPEL